MDETDENVRFASGKPHRPHVGNQFQPDHGKALLKLGQSRDDKVLTEEFGHSQPDNPGQIVSWHRGAPFKGKELGFHLLRKLKKRLAPLGEHVAVRPFGEKFRLECVFQGRDPARHRRLAHPEQMGRLRQAVKSCNGEKVPKIVPVHCHHVRNEKRVCDNGAGRQAGQR
jgi:hypothetical protein